MQKICKICKHEMHMQNMQTYALPTSLMEEETLVPRYGGCANENL